MHRIAFNLIWLLMFGAAANFVAAEDAPAVAVPAADARAADDAQAVAEKARAAKELAAKERLDKQRAAAAAEAKRRAEEKEIKRAAAQKLAEEEAAKAKAEAAKNPPVKKAEQAPEPVKVVEPPKPVVLRNVTKAAARIDKILDQSLTNGKIAPSPAADDAEFLRRIHLDLTGRLPSPESATQFLDSREPDKRAKLIDELIMSPAYGAHFARYWAELFVKRDFQTNGNTRTETFRAWMAERLNVGIGWDCIVSELLAVEGSAPSNMFLQMNKLSGERVSPAKVVGASANLFLGIQFQCAECHNHPYRSEWSHEDFWGMAAYFGRTRFDKGTEKNQVIVTETDQPPPDPAAKNKPRIIVLPTGGKIDIPDPLDAKKIKTSTEAKLLVGETPPVAEKGPHRPQFAAWLTGPENPWFAQASVNRLWSVFFGRGLVNPLDNINPDNAPTHPEVLALLMDEFKQSECDYRHVIRVICNTAAYQRSSFTPADSADDEQYGRMPVKFLQGEVLRSCLDQVLGVEKGPPAKRRDINRVSAVQTTEELFDSALYDDIATNYSFGAPQLLRMINAEIPRRAKESVSTLLATERTAAGHVEHLFLSALARRPTTDESQTMVVLVEQSESPAAGYEAVLWVLLNSAEFVSNH